MKQIFILLFFIGFIGHEARGNYDDPAPGRSPGPPIQQQTSLASELYSIEASHEAYRPLETSSDLHQQQQGRQHEHEERSNDNSDVETIMNSRNRFSDIFSSMSRENIEYHDNTNENDNSQDNIATNEDNKDILNFRRQKLIINKSTEMTGRLDDINSNNVSKSSESDDETALNALKNSSLTLQHASSVKNIHDSDTSDKMAKMIKSDCVHSVMSGKIFNYLRLGDKIVKMDVNDSENEYYDSRIPSDVGKLQIYVTHDVFSTETSLLAGIIYKVEVLQPQPRDFIDFMLESTAQNGNEMGIFPETPVDYHQTGDVNDVVVQIVTSDSGKKDANLNSNNNMKQGINEPSDCERNIIYRKLSISDEKVTLNWTTGDIELSSGKNLVNFRLLYRYRNKREIFEINFSIRIVQECSLTLKEYTGWLDSTLLPYRYRNCTFHFPKLTQNLYKSQPPGMLVKLLRLNVPCTSGGFVRFNDTITLCGKLEELSESQRTLYFHSYNNTSFSIFNYPKFYFVYKLVDYCYNITLMNQNSSFSIQPMSHLALKCHFKIHLPFGHDISLKLRINGNSNNVQSSIVRDIHMTKSSKRDDDNSIYRDYNKIEDEFIELEKFSSDIESRDHVTTKSDCEWIFIEIINRLNERWSECLKLSESQANIEYKLSSSDNVLLIRIVKKQKMEMQHISSTKSHVDSEMNSKKDTSILNLEYTAVPIENIVSQCAFGWILIGQFCVASFDELTAWQDAEDKCNNLGGHLASINNENEQQLVDKMLINSAHYNEHVSYWIGATDKHLEGDFRWTDSQQFSFTKWFPGWQEHGNYNRQPNDDGLSEQDCVEIRRFYHRPSTSGISSTTSSLTESFMWNDRDCATKNFFLCERPLIDEPVGTLETDDCNKTIHLTRDNMKMSITSPGYPRYYPDNVNCFTFITAVPGFRIYIEFDELVLENEPQCSYDYVEMFEPFLNANSTKSMRQKRNHEDLMINDFTSLQQQQLHEFQQLLRDYETQKDAYRNIFQPSNSTYNTFIPPPSTLSDRMPRKMCGDWSSKLKLLRHRSRSNFLGIRFSSDYSHHYSGFKAKISLEKAASECVDERLKLFNESCYLVVSFPEVEWVVAQKICHSMGAQLSSVSSSDEHRFIITAIRNNADYNHRRFYWLGGEYSKDGEFEWTDGSKISFNGGWVQGQEKLMSKSQKDPACLGLEWKTSGNSRLPSNLFWSSQKCSQLGGYVCKQNKKSNILIQNMTITEIEGRLTSPDYPNHYSSNINYWVKIIAPKRSRIIMQFQKIDIEYQQECLYDYVSVQDSEFHYVQMNQNDLKIPSKIGIVNIDETSTRQVLDRRRRSVNNKIEIKTVGVNDSSPSFQSYVRWCGNHDGDMSKFDFVSRSNEILLNFFTDNSIAGEGFSAIWRSIDASACPSQTLTSREGNLSSPNFPHFLLHNLNCSYNIQAPIGRKIWIEFLAFNIEHDASVYIDLGDGFLLQPFQEPNEISDGVYASLGERIKIYLKTGSNPRGKGFNVVFRTMPQIVEHRVVNLSNSTFGRVYHLNYPHPKGMPESIDYTQHLIAPPGDVISIELRGVQFTENGCNESAIIEIYDKYADRNGTFWQLCTVNAINREQTPPPAIFITSYLNTIHIRLNSINNQLGILNATVRVQSDINYKMKLITSTEDWVESCNPNPCQHGGKCILSDKKQICQCVGHYTGRFCGLTMCELEPCVFGQCELTGNSFKCHCQAGYLGITCDQRQKPCNDNPCENRGQCIEKNGGYECRCFAWFEGPKCERRMKIPYRPLSERMLQEPFWLGLITVFVVLAVIGIVWCAKRHFPEKIEKLLQEEADRNRPAHLRHHHHISLREQLQVAGAANNPIMQGTTPTANNVTTPGSDSRKSIFNRLGIRKPSILSLSSPQIPSGSTARTFSLDDLLRPPPRQNHHNSHVGTPSPRKKRNNSTPTRKNNAEKKQILQQLISPSTNKVTLGELIQLSENSNSVPHTNSMSHDSDDVKETAFNDSSTSTLVGSGLLTRQLSSDPKLEKKVTFARLLSKMSAEITNGSDIDANNHSSALSLPTEVQFRANSVPQSPCTNDIRSPHSTSSNQGSGSLSSSELALHDLSFRNNINNRKNRPKVSSADSILAMFRNFASSNAGVNLPASLVISPSSSPTASSPQDDIAGDDESSTSSIPTPVSFTSNAPDSPVFYRQSTIEVPVLDALSAHKSTPVQNHLHPPTILLEIPGNINKCLSPIRELPTPMPSPALTPVMPRPQRIVKSTQVHDETISVTFSDEDEKNPQQHKQHILVDISRELNRKDDSENDDSTTTPTNTISSSDNSHGSVRQSKLVSMPAIDICPPTPVETERRRFPMERPKDLIIPELTVQTPSPTKERLPLLIFPGSPPPQRASIGETSGLFPNKQQQKRLLMQYDKYEKPGSLDFQFAPPMITIIPANMSEAESDAEFISPVTSKASLMPNSKLNPNTTCMSHLSPFSMCTRGDRAPSEGNLSSSGYSSMASPGPSRCSSNNPLCPNESDCNSSHCGDITITVPTIMRRHQSILKKNDGNLKGIENNSDEQQFRKRSDSETLSDETLLESNDEGIGTDHLDEKIEDGDIKSAKELEIFIGNEFLENGKNLLAPEEVLTMSQLQLPSIVIQSESGYDKLSPVSSRSESPLSDRNNNGMGRFSPQFYNKREQQLPFTDSDGLYDFPSSDGKSGGHYRKSAGKRRDKRILKSNQPISPSKATVHLEIPQKAITVNHAQTNISSKYNSSNVTRKSPKRRSHARYTPSSSSSTESLTASSNTKETSMPSIKLRDSLIETIESRQYVNVLDDADKYGSGSSSCSLKNTEMLAVKKNAQPPKKVSRLKAIGHQIRFLRRLEQALRERDRSMSDSCNDNESDVMDSPKATSPLLASSNANAVKSKSSNFKFSRQKRVMNVYSFELDRENSLIDKDLLSD